jgi:hypothetical protein
MAGRYGFTVSILLGLEGRALFVTETMLSDRNRERYESGTRKKYRKEKKQDRYRSGRVGDQRQAFRYL